MSVEVRRPDGSTEKVRVGTAFRDGDGFTLELGKMSIGSAPEPSAGRAPRRERSGGGSPGGQPDVFPPYGRSKGLPISGASMGDLEFYRNGAMRTLNDPGKARFHDKERALLQAIDAEIARQKGGGGGGGDEEPPPPSDDDAF